MKAVSESSHTLYLFSYSSFCHLRPKIAKAIRGGRDLPFYRSCVDGEKRKCFGIDDVTVSDLAGREFFTAALRLLKPRGIS